MQKNPGIIAVEITYNLPVVNWDSSITSVSRSYKVYYYKDYIMYEFGYRYDSNVNYQNIKSEIRNRFLILRTGDRYGEFYYPEANPPFTDRVLIDSVLGSNALKENGFDTLVNFTSDSSYTDDQNNLVKVYRLPLSAEFPEQFTYYLYYNHDMEDVRETFSAKMDKIDDKKLFRVKSMAGGGYYEKLKMSFPPRQILYEMKKFPVRDPEKILGYFDRYRKEHPES